jgi:DUF1680 family protein
MKGKVETGYIRVEREWKNGDKVQLDLAMPIERVHANPNVTSNLNRVAIQRGPVVYCLEGVDNNVPLNSVSLPDKAKLQAQFEKDLLGGVTVITGEAMADDTSDWNNTLYRTESPKRKSVKIKAIPYYAWDNRAPGRIAVWLPSR